MTIEHILGSINFNYVLAVTKIMFIIILILEDVLEATKITNNIE